MIEGLVASGYSCCEEVSRGLIREQHAAGGTLLPWRDLPGFAAECERRMQVQLAAAAPASPTFFDRGLPDIIAYLRFAGLRPTPALFAAARAYTPLVFLAPSWAEIYINDPERPQSFSEAVGLHAELERSYRECGFEIVSLPRAPVNKRVAFIENTLGEARTRIAS